MDEGCQVFPVEIWLKITLNLDYDSLTRFSKVNKLMNTISSDETLWHKLYQRHWQEHGLGESDKDLTWRRRFIDMYKLHGKYISCYAKIKTAWNKIEEILKEKCPDMFTLLKDPATEDELDLIEIKLGCPLPLDLRCSFQIHNGQRMLGPGIMGNIMNTNTAYSECLLDVQTAVAGIQVLEGLRDCLPITNCIYSGVTQYLALSEFDGHPTHQIFYPTDCKSSPWECRRKDFFISSKNFTSWFTTYADKLYRNLFSICNNVPSKFEHDENWMITKDSITATVETCFISSLNGFYHDFNHLYRLQINFSEDLPADYVYIIKPYQCTVNENGREETFTILSDSGTKFTAGSKFLYDHSISVKTSHATVQCICPIININTGKVTVIKCPVTVLRSLPYMTAEDRIARKQAYLQREKVRSPSGLRCRRVKLDINIAPSNRKKTS